MESKTKLAVEMFNGGLYCSQALLCAFCEGYGLDKGTAAKISCGLNSGCRNAEICGAVSGAILVIGLKYGGDKGLCNSKTEEFSSVLKPRIKVSSAAIFWVAIFPNPPGVKRRLKIICSKQNALTW